MVKLVIRGGIPHPLLNHLFVTDLDRLENITSAAGTAPLEQMEKLADDFTSIIVHLRVGAFHKRTGSGRLPHTQQALAKHLAGSGPINVLDMGASDGITTVQLVTALETVTGRPCTAVSADLYQNLHVFEGSGLTEYRTSDGMPVMVRQGRRAVVLPESKDSRDLLRNWLARRYMRRRDTLPEMKKVRQVRLINPWVLRSTKVEPVEASILERQTPWLGKFDAIRASNVINPRFFDTEARRKIFGLCHEYLKPDGLLLVSRNHIEGGEETERGTLWQRTNEGFVRLEDFGHGSEIASDVDAWRRTAAMAT